MANHPPRITASNTRIQLLEGSLGHTCPKGEDDLGWVQLQQTSLMWQEMIESFSVITHEGLTTLAHSSRMGWTITSGTWSHLREKWGPTPETLLKIQASCKDQEHLEESNKLTPSRHILLALRQIWDLERIHGLPAVAAPAFFPSASRNEECWWGTPDSKTVYVWDSMDDQDKLTSMSTLQETENWVVWKTRDKSWTHTLQQQGFHQLLSFHKDEKENISGSKIKGW